ASNATTTSPPPSSSPSSRPSSLTSPRSATTPSSSASSSPPDDFEDLDGLAHPDPRLRAALQRRRQALSAGSSPAPTSTAPSHASGSTTGTHRTRWAHDPDESAGATTSAVSGTPREALRKTV